MPGNARHLPSQRERAHVARVRADQEERRLHRITRVSFSSWPGIVLPLLRATTLIGGCLCITTGVILLRFLCWCWQILPLPLLPILVRTTKIRMCTRRAYLGRISQCICGHLLYIVRGLSVNFAPLTPYKLCSSHSRAVCLARLPQARGGMHGAACKAGWAVAAASVGPCRAAHDFAEDGFNPYHGAQHAADAAAGGRVQLMLPIE